MRSLLRTTALFLGLVCSGVAAASSPPPPPRDPALDAAEHALTRALNVPQLRYDETFQRRILERLLDSWKNAPPGFQGNIGGENRDGTVVRILRDRMPYIYTYCLSVVSASFVYRTEGIQVADIEAITRILQTRPGPALATIMLQNNSMVDDYFARNLSSILEREIRGIPGGSTSEQAIAYMEALRTPTCRTWQDADFF